MAERIWSGRFGTPKTVGDPVGRAALRVVDGILKDGHDLQAQGIAPRDVIALYGSVLMTLCDAFDMPVDEFVEMVSQMTATYKAANPNSPAGHA